MSSDWRFIPVSYTHSPSGSCLQAHTEITKLYKTHRQGSWRNQEEKSHATHCKEHAEKILQSELWWKNTHKYLQKHHKQGTGFHSIQWLTLIII